MNDAERARAALAEFESEHRARLPVLKNPETMDAKLRAVFNSESDNPVPMAIFRSEMEADGYVKLHCRHVPAAGVFPIRLFGTWENDHTADGKNL